MKFSVKLFTAFTLMAVIVVGLTIGLAWFYFSRNFNEYAEKAIFEKYNNIYNSLTREYEKNNSWDSIRLNKERWDEILKENVPKNKEYSKEVQIILKFKSRRFILFDGEMGYLAGGFSNKNPDMYLLKEIVVDGKISGWFGFHRRDHKRTPLEIKFLMKQRHALFIIGFGILILAAIITYLISRHLLSPIRDLTRGTKALAERNFDFQIEVKSKDELGQLAWDFNNMAKALKRSENLREQWISDIAHELRTPLLILSGEIEAMKDGIREADDKNLDSVYSETKHLIKIVNDLHELTVADSGTLFLKKKDLDPSELLSETVEYFRTSLIENSVEVNWEKKEKCRIFSDERRLKQVFTNIFQNAVQYMDKPGILRLESFSDEENLNIHIEDTGPGVKEAELPKLFDRLYRVEKSRNRNRGGSGLGLSICRSFITAIGGNISAEKSKYGGLKIMISLPKGDLK